MNIPRFAVFASFCLALAGCGRSAPGDYTGWIEADLIFVGAEDFGRIETIAVKEGQLVHPGDPLFSVAVTTQSADVAAAQALFAEAQSRLARLEVQQQRPEEIAVLESAQRQAQAALDFSTADLERARELARKGIAAQARLDQAQAAYERDRAALESSRRQILVGKLNARPEDIDTARAAMRQASAQADAARSRLMRLSVAAKVTGHVQEIYYRAGEIVPVGRPIVSVLPPENMKLRFFVGESDLPSIVIGQPVAISCDGCRDGLTARVSFIAAKAEFTPPVIYSLEERRKLVFKVEARPDQPDALRIGQPVKVRTEAGAK